MTAKLAPYQYAFLKYQKSVFTAQNLVVSLKLYRINQQHFVNSGAFQNGTMRFH